MYERMRVVLAAIFFYTGLTYLALRIKERSDRRLLILNYHNAGGHLESQIRYLRRHYRIMHLEEALEELYAPAMSSSRRNRHLPLVLTFDDGYIDNYTIGFHLAQRYHVPITIFLIPGYVESGRYFWWLAARKLISQIQSDQVTFAGQTYQICRLQERQKLTALIDAKLSHATSVAERERALQEIQQTLGVVLPDRETMMDDTRLPMNWVQIREMEATGLVSYGAHTMNHPILAFVSDVEEVTYEVKESRQVLEKQLGHPVRVFAYPVGKMQHIGEQGIIAVRAAGFSWAVTTFETLCTRESDVLLLGRMPGDTSLNWMVMAAELVGLLGIMSRIRKKYAKLFI